MACSIYCPIKQLIQKSLYIIIFVVIFSFSGSSQHVPSISFIQEELMISRKDPLILEPEISFSSSYPSDRKIFFHWSQLEGPSLPESLFSTINSNTTEDQRSFYVQPFQFPQPHTYVINLQATPRVSPGIAISLNVTVRVIEQELQCSPIEGGMKIASRLDIIKLESICHDPDQMPESDVFIWECHFGNPSQECEGIIWPAQPIVLIPPSSLQGNTMYNLELIYRKGNRETRKNITIDVVDPMIPATSISPLEERIPVGRRLWLRGVIANRRQFSSIAYRWSVVSGNIHLNATTLVVNNVVRRFIVFEENALSPNSEYIIRFEATGIHQGIIGVGYSEYKIRTLPDWPPRTVSVSPGVGNALETYFQICVTHNSQSIEQFYYSFYFQNAASGEPVLLALPTTKNCIRTMLPPNHSGNTLNLLVRVTDSFWVETEYTANVQVMRPGFISSNAQIIDYLQSSSSILAFAETYYSKRDALNAVAIGSALLNYVSPTPADLATPIRERMALLLSRIDTLYGRQTISDFSSPIISLVKRKAETTFKMKYSLINLMYSLIRLRLIPIVRQIQKVHSCLSALSIDNLDLSAFEESDLSEIRKAAESYLDMVQRVITSYLQHKVPDEVATSLETGSVFGAAMISEPQYLNGAVYENEETRIVFPNNFQRNISGVLSDIFTEEFISTRLLVFNNDPLFWSTYHDPLTSVETTVVSLTFGLEDGTEKKLSNLADPIQLRLPGRFNLSMFELNGTTRYTPKCKFWNENIMNWDEQGCSLREITPTYMLCECSHTSIFTGVIDVTIIIPDMVFINMTLVYELNSDNMVPFIASVCITFTYLIIMIIATSIESICNLLKSRKAKPKGESHEFGKEVLKVQKKRLGQAPGMFRYLFKRFRQTSIWFSIFLPKIERKNFSRSQRITVCYITVLSIMMFSSHVWGTEKRLPIKAHWLPSAFIVEIFTVPFTIFFTVLFLKTGQWKRKKKNLNVEEKLKAATKGLKTVDIDVAEGTRETMKFFAITKSTLNEVEKKYKSKKGNMETPNPSIHSSRNRASSMIRERADSPVLSVRSQASRSNSPLLFTGDSPSSQTGENVSNTSPRNSSHSRLSIHDSPLHVENMDDENIDIPGTPIATLTPIPSRSPKLSMEIAEEKEKEIEKAIVENTVAQLPDEEEEEEEEEEEDNELSEHETEDEDSEEEEVHINLEPAIGSKRKGIYPCILRDLMLDVGDVVLGKIAKHYGYVIKRVSCLGLFVITAFTTIYIQFFLTFVGYLVPTTFPWYTDTYYWSYITLGFLIYVGYMESMLLYAKIRQATKRKGAFMSKLQICMCLIMMLIVTVVDVVVSCFMLVVYGPLFYTRLLVINVGTLAVNAFLFAWILFMFYDPSEEERKKLEQEQSEISSIGEIESPDRRLSPGPLINLRRGRVSSIVSASSIRLSPQVSPLPTVADIGSPKVVIQGRMVEEQQQEIQERQRPLQKLIRCCTVTFKPCVVVLKLVARLLAFLSKQISQRILEDIWFPWWFKFVIYLLVVLFNLIAVMIITANGSIFDTFAMNNWIYTFSFGFFVNIWITSFLVFFMDIFTFSVLVRILEAFFFKPQKRDREDINLLDDSDYDDSSEELDEDEAFASRPQSTQPSSHMGSSGISPVHTPKTTFEKMLSNT